MTRVHLVRHGEVNNPRGVVYGELPGFGLSRLGRLQVAAAAKRLRDMLDLPPTIVSSPLERARETAAILHAGLAGADAVVVEPALTEAGSFRDGLPRRFAPLAYARRLLDPAARARIEAPRTVIQRMVAAVRAAAARGGDMVLVSHQFPIWMATVGFEHPSALAARLPWLFIRRPCTYASITTVAFGAARAAVAYWEPPA